MKSIIDFIKRLIPYILFVGMVLLVLSLKVFR